MALNCILVFFSWSCTHTEKNLQNLQLQLEGWCPEVTQDPRVPEPEGPQTWAPPRLAGTLKTREHPQGCGDARWSPVCPSSGSLCILHSVPRSPGLGRQGPPQSLCSWWWTRDAPCCPYGVWRAELAPEEGDEEAPGGDLQRGHTGTAAPGLLHTVAPQCTQPLEQPAQQHRGRLWTGPVPWGYVLRASSTYLYGLLPPLVCTILVTFNRRSQGFCWWFWSTSKWVQDMMGTCALFGLTFSSHALHSHLLFQVFIITKDIPQSIPQKDEQRVFWYLEGIDQSGSSNPSQGRKATIWGSPGQCRLHGACWDVWVQTYWLQPQLLLRPLMVTKPGSRVQTWGQERGRC